jgi:hypothetical protein
MPQNSGVFLCLIFRKQMPVLKPTCLKPKQFGGFFILNSTQNWLDEGENSTILTTKYKQFHNSFLL